MLNDGHSRQDEFHEFFRRIKAHFHVNLSPIFTTTELLLGEIYRWYATDCVPPTPPYEDSADPYSNPARFSYSHMNLFLRDENEQAEFDGTMIVEAELLGLGEPDFRPSGETVDLKLMGYWEIHEIDGDETTKFEQKDTILARFWVHTIAPDRVSFEIDSWYMHIESVRDFCRELFLRLVENHPEIGQKPIDYFPEHYAEEPQIVNQTDTKPYLTEREKQVARLLATGVNRGRIAREMHIEPATVDTYKKKIAEKWSIATSKDGALGEEARRRGYGKV